MATRKLSDSAAQNLPFQAVADGQPRNYLVWDSELAGFGLRVGATSKVWLVAYRNAAREQKKLKLGAFPGVRADAARRAARIALGEVAAGRDPAAAKAEERRRAVAVISDCLDRYLKGRQVRKVVAAEQEDRALRKGLGPKWLASDVAQLDRQELVRLMDKIRETRGDGAAEYFRKSARTFLDWCVSSGLMVGNPLAGYRKPRQTKAERITSARRGRALEQSELGKVWNAAGTDSVFGRMVRFIALTGCRKSEAAALEWPWIDAEAGTVTIPDAVAKMGRDHVIPITPALQELLATCPKLSRTKLVFPSSRTKGQISGWSKMMPRLIDKAGVSFTLHDLRRSLKTHLREMGFDNDLASLMIGHARDSFEARYDKSELLGLRRKAANAYADLVLAAASVERKNRIGLAVDNERCSV